MTEPVIAILSVTCRPHWQPWLLHQYGKQTHAMKQLVVFDDAMTAQRWPGHVIVHRAKLGSLGEKRQYLLDRTTGPFCWMDDDDWHPACRLDVGAALLGHVDIVGCRDGIFTDVETHRTRRLELANPVVFNSAVFANNCRLAFQPLHTGEDTAWLSRVGEGRRVCSTPELRHCWLSHDSNITGKRGSMSFEGPRFAKFDSWELEFLRALAH